MPAIVYIRADGSHKKGLGHLVRCIALANMLKPNFDIHFICEEIPDKIKNEIRQAGFLLTLTNNEEQFFSLLSGNEIVVLDHYGLNSQYQKRVKETGCKLVCIDDLHEKVFYADLIINHAPGIKPKDYRVQHYTKFALGMDFALLRPAFLKAAKKNRVIDRVETTCICFGGSDNQNLTLKTLKLVLKLDIFKKVIVITGSAYFETEEFRELIRSSNNVKYYHSVNERQMVALLTNTDLAIVPSSGILFEAIAAGCIALTSYYVDNQKKIFDGFKKMDNVVAIDSFTHLNNEAIMNASKMTTIHNKQMIDGFSDKRILNLMNDL